MKDLVVLYDKEDVLEFNKYNKEFENVFLFSPGIESFLKKNQNINIIKPKISSDSLLQKEIINKSKKIYKKFEENLHSLNGIDKGIIENIHNIFFVSVFSFMYLIENLKEYQNFKLIYKNEYYEFDNFKSFIPLFLEKIFLKRNQDFFFYLRSAQLSKYKKMMIIINNFICTFVKRVNSKLISGSLLTKKIAKENKNNEMIIFQLKPYQDFKIYHILLNFLSTVNIFKKKKFYIYFRLIPNAY